MKAFLLKCFKKNSIISLSENDFSYLYIDAMLLLTKTLVANSQLKRMHLVSLLPEPAVAAEPGSAVLAGSAAEHWW